ncbi:hypothetical protein BVC71_12770 [Marivivens niveibacter]|uniref:Chemotaxis protein CheR n=1 Tax=Marivivens niveibacter TaxID=1930667 RepID=A0A251WV68_9RHOB|nr:CheR family methyltransferase [Marivivens niveibacter]OUD08379.1 hypothetical protein BVC71_12770 [Marivivens niveibacter]
MVAVVAIGTSAGGLKPLEHFFHGMEPDTKNCYVIIQHLSPGYNSLMDELLGRQSALKIKKIQDGDRLEPGTIYLNSPSFHIELIDDCFKLVPYTQNDDIPRLPIDHFFRSLAYSGNRPAVGVILSGTGSDGSKGAAVLQKSGGIIFTQTPKEAEFDAMPQATLKECPTAITGSANELPALIDSGIEKLQNQDLAATNVNPLKEIFNLIETEHGIDFSHYKERTILRRIQRRREITGAKDDNELLLQLKKDPIALRDLYSDLLIGVTEFFRDPECFDLLKEIVYPSLVEKIKSGEDIRIWVPACATGEEAYSIAIDFAETLHENKAPLNFRIIATDIFQPAIDIASAGSYSKKQLKKLPKEIRQRYFDETNSGFTIKNAIRQKIIFSRHNAISNAPFMRIDLISCRNMMIYLGSTAQEQLLSRFTFGLEKNGFLLLGPSENLSTYSGEFDELSSKWRIFRKNSDNRRRSSTLFSNSGPAFKAMQVNERSRNQHIQQRALASRPAPVENEYRVDAASREYTRNKLIAGYDALLKRYAPSSILVDTDGDVLTWFGSAGMYIDTKSNLANWRVSEIVHPDLQYFINIALERIRKHDLEPYRRRIQLTNEEGVASDFNLTIEALGTTTQSSRPVLATFSLTSETEEADDQKHHVEHLSSAEADRDILNARINELTRDLRLTEESLQFVTERLETNAEELQASNEELQASNEELQASNEELQASNEELQAVNEELLSVSAEHERKIELIIEAAQDTEILLEIIGAACLFTDEDHNIIRFSGRMGQLMGFEPQDVNRPIANVGQKLDFVSLEDLANQARITETDCVAKGELKGKQLEIKCRYIHKSTQSESNRFSYIFAGEAIESIT